MWPGISIQLNHAVARRGQPTYPALEDWIEIFRHSIGSFRRTAEADVSMPLEARMRAAQQFADSYRRAVDAAEQAELAAYASGYLTVSSDGGVISGDGREPLGCLELCRLREEALLAAGFSDIFRSIKRQENDAALALLPGVCAELDGHTDQVGGVGGGGGRCGTTL